MQRGLLKTPAELGFRMPAEWERHAATWLVWPHNRSDWPAKVAPIPWVYGEIVRKIAPGERLRIIVKSRTHEAVAQRILARIGVNLSQVDFWRLPTNRGWTRDFGPMFVKRDATPSAPVHTSAPTPTSAPTATPLPAAAPAAAPLPPELAIARFRFTGWARYPDWQKDDKVPERVARGMRRKLYRARHKTRDVVLEGGSIDVNGCGTLLTTEECLLSRTQSRNPGLRRAEMEATLKAYLGVTQVLWLGRGLSGDDTHGHVDNFCRFVNRRTVVIMQEDDSRDPNYRTLYENRERLQDMKLEDGSKPEVIPLPMPEPLFLDGQRLPASYANFYICNAAVLVPTFNDPRDRLALGTLAELFPDRPVVGIHAVDLVLGLGTLHCLTQQEPAL